jgi:hypothetical protein
MVLAYGSWGCGLLHCGHKSLVGERRDINLRSSVLWSACRKITHDREDAVGIRFRMIEGVCRDCYGIDEPTAGRIRPSFPSAISAPSAGTVYRKKLPRLDMSRIVADQVEMLRREFPGVELDPDEPSCVCCGSAPRYSHVANRTSVSVPDPDDPAHWVAQQSNNLYFAFMVRDGEGEQAFRAAGTGAAPMPPS